MKVPSTMNVFCPHCRKKTKHTVKLYKKGRTSNASEGQRKHLLKTKHGYKGKTAGKVTVYKQSKRQSVVLTCSECGKSHPKTLGSRTKKVLEVEKV